MNNRNHEKECWEPLNCTIETRDDDDVPLFFTQDDPRSPSRKSFGRPGRHALKKSISTRRLKKVFGMLHFPMHKPTHMGYQEHGMSFHEDGSDTSESYIYDLSIEKSESVDSWMSFSEDGYSCDASPAQFNALEISDLSDLSASLSSSSSTP
ncbi:unnamed protein product, partial [Cylindrotheca closterium]